MTLNMWQFEQEMVCEGYKLICGVDEAGRGPLAGPVYAAAVILPLEAEFSGLGDSKKLSEKTRDRLFDEIIETAVCYGIGTADHKEIDELNILKATFLAMNRAIESLEITPDIALIDGNRDPQPSCRSRCIVGGDAKSASIAAASILAKVSRDRYMLEMAEKYPDYAFERHKGYGTKLHYERLYKYGPSEIHRITFLKKMLNSPQQTDAKRRGDAGEKVALEYLEKKGYVVIAKGFRSQFGEIDLIVKNSGYIVFIEVKLRKNAKFASAGEHVGKEKQSKIKATANIWLTSHETALQPRFDVIEIYASDDMSNPEIIHIENAF